LKFGPQNLHVEQFYKQPTRWKLKFQEKQLWEPIYKKMNWY
jgi:hypothetical protein